MIEIKDAKRTVDGKRKNGYRVRTVGENNEVLQSSEVLNSVDAVKTHLLAMCKAWSSDDVVLVFDKTNRQKFSDQEIEFDFKKTDKINYGLIEPDSDNK